MTRTLSTRLVEGSSARLELEKAEIRVTGGPDRGAACQLHPAPIVVGSSSQCDLVLHDSSVSARHAEITAASGGYVLRDLHSTNGILVGSYRVKEIVLADRMRLTLGESSLQVRALGEILSFALERPGQLGQLMAHSVKMRAFVALLKQAALSDTVTVLLEGETGTGKGVAAEALHAASPRRHGPFVVFDCAAVNRSLAAAELFGYERGAFTGAEATRKGIYEEAEGGTLFLDEIGDLPLELQPLLLASLERRSSRRLGGSEQIGHDVRVVAATNRNLAEEVKAGRFRQDLFYRLSVVRLRVPPLRERPEDLDILAGLFATDAGFSLSPDLLVALKAHHWPGNLRELRNTIERFSIELDDGQVRWRSEVQSSPGLHPGLDDGDPIFDAGGELRTLPDARREMSDRFELRYLRLVLERARGGVSRAAGIAGVTRQALTMLINKHGLRSRK